MFTVEEEVSRTTQSVSSAPSLACDLTWLLHFAFKPCSSIQARYPQVVDMFDARQDLADRVRAFWGDDDEKPFLIGTVVQALAHIGGALRTTDPVTLWHAIESAVPQVPLELVMPSESPEDIEAIRDRLAQLKESPAQVRAFLDLLQEVWMPVDDLWQQALPVITESGSQIVTEYERGRSLDALIPPGCHIQDERLPLIVAGVQQGRPLLFVPCLFFGKSMYLEFPDLYVIGVGVGGDDVAARERTESVAKRLKAVADPTRLAILHSLAATPSTVGDLAVLFRLAQPTVSMHVKVLRENGLVRSERVDGRLRLNADPVAVEALLTDMRDAVLQGVVPVA
jgi:ArsR family transcriptional regulator